MPAYPPMIVVPERDACDPDDVIATLSTMGWRAAVLDVAAPAAIPSPANHVRMVEMLRRFEWAPDRTEPSYVFCPVCKGERSTGEGHRDGCELAALLR